MRSIGTDPQRSRLLRPRRGPAPGSLLRAVLLAGLAGLAGCASLTPDAGLATVRQLAQGKTAGTDWPLSAEAAADPAAVQTALAQLLAQPVTAHSAVQIALLNNPGLQAALASLRISDAERVQAASLPNPHLALGRFVEGQRLEIERILSFNVLGLLTLPWRSEWASQQQALAQLQAAQTVVRLAAQTRKAWIDAVAAQQSLAYLRDVREAAEAGAELARRMARVGNWSRLQQAREQVFLADAQAQVARAEHQAVAARERLTRQLGLWGEQTGYRLSTRLPDLPEAPDALAQIEAQALRERLDLRAAVAESTYVARSLGFVKATGYVNALSLSVKHTSSFDSDSGSHDRLRGWELELPLPIFDWGSARNARAQGLYLQSVERVREVAVQARSEAREAYHAYRSAYDLARHQREQVLPLRRFINDETVLRYNGMLASVWDLLADTRALVQASQAAILAQRDFWLADTDLQLSLSGTSPGSALGSFAAGSAGTGAAASSAQGH